MLFVLRSAVLNAGYEVSLSHAAKNSLKTNAPVDFIWVGNLMHSINRVVIIYCIVFGIIYILTLLGQ